jgi:hypothetical protein
MDLSSSGPIFFGTRVPQNTQSLLTKELPVLKLAGIENFAGRFLWGPRFPGGGEYASHPVKTCTGPEKWMLMGMRPPESGNEA